jgi:tetratricopeptide (TPR) repeat protein
VELFDGHLQSSRFARRYDLDSDRLLQLKEEIARRIAGALNRPLRDPLQRRARYSQDPLAYAQFVQGYKRISPADPRRLEEATEHLMNAVARDPEFALAHAELSYVCAARHFEFDPSRVWLEKAEFHCHRSLELDPDLPEGHVAKAFLLWGPSKNFQHLEAIAELKRALALQKNLPHAYNRMGTILAHIGLLDHARNMYEMGSAYDPRKAVSHSIFQVYLWNGDYERAQDELCQWKAESPASKYAIHFGPYLAMLRGQWDKAKSMLNDAAGLTPEEPLVISQQGLLHALTGYPQEAMECVTRACANPRSFGHAHHTHYQIACIFSVLKQPATAFEWLEHSVDSGFACWPFFLIDPYLRNLRELPQFELLVSSLQAKYPDHLGML